MAGKGCWLLFALKVVRMCFYELDWVFLNPPVGTTGLVVSTLVILITKRRLIVFVLEKLLDGLVLLEWENWYCFETGSPSWTTAWNQGSNPTFRHFVWLPLGKHGALLAVDIFILCNAFGTLHLAGYCLLVWLLLGKRVFDSALFDCDRLRRTLNKSS